MLKRINKILASVCILAVFLIYSNLFSNFSNVFANDTKINAEAADMNKDTTPPHTPQGFSVKTLDGKLEINWRQNVKEDEIDKYLIYLRTGAEKKDEDPIEVEKDKTSYVVKNLGKTMYYVSLAAKDKAGNISQATAEIGIAPNSSGVNTFQVAGWMPLIDMEDQKKTLNNNFDLFSIISPFEYSLEPDGSINRHGEVLSFEDMDKLRSAGKKIIPSVTNNFDDNNKGSNVLSDWHKRKKNIDSIVNEVMDKSYDGIDIDYENLDQKVCNDFSLFIINLAKELHERGKILSVTLQAKQSDDEAWTKAYDFEKLGKAADQIRIMTYDYKRPNTTPGPIAPIKWMAEAITYAQSKIDSSKIFVGLPFYAYDWCEQENCENKGLVWDGVKNIIEKYNIETEWDDEAKAPWFYYKDDEGRPHTVYFENGRSIEEKINVIKKLGVAGVAIWRLGNEDPKNFEAIKGIEGKAANSVSNIKVEPYDQAIGLSWDAAANSDLKGYKVLYRKKEGNTRKLSVFGQNNIRIPNLENNAPYYLSIIPITWDELLNDEFNNEEIFDGQIVATPQDLAFPMTISDLKVDKIKDTTVDLFWTAAGDDYNKDLASGFDIRFAEFQINKDNFNSAAQYKMAPEPQLPGAKQMVQIKNLFPGTTYYFAVKTLDEANNVSLISNIVKADTIDTIPPKVPAKPVALAGDGKLEISWKQNKDKDLAGYKIYYKQEKAYYDIAIIKPEQNIYLLEGLENNYHYFVSLSAFDQSKNESARTEEIEVIPKSNKMLDRMQDGANRSAEKLQAAAMIFGKRLFSAGAVPYLIMFAIIIINVFIFAGIRKEIAIRVKEAFKHEKKSVKKKIILRKKSDVVDLRGM